MNESPLRALAFYLPQFHPIPENDRWWGPGFTEWTNVARARPRFRGHYQPHIPRDLGFYDLRLREARMAQAELVRSAGLEGLCYYHYWFNGTRLLHRPLDLMLSSREPELPFCLCWANEDWTRAWDGRSSDYLVKQCYSPEDDESHIRWLLQVFADSRYIRINGRPLFLFYRVEKMPDIRRTAETWRRVAIEHGEAEPFLCNVQSFDNVSPDRYELDAAVEFQPDWQNLPQPYRPRLLSDPLRARRAIRRGLTVYSYQQHVGRALEVSNVGYKRFPCVTPSFDNSPRRLARGVVFHGCSPQLYEAWLRQATKRAMELVGQERILFINAWNEWGEGNHLEPCLRWGRAYIDATAAVLNASAQRP